MKHEARATERNQLIVGVLRATLMGGGEMLEGEVCNVSAHGAGIHLLPEQLIGLRPGDETILSFQRPGQPQQLVVRAVLRHSLMEDTEMHYGFEFAQRDGIRRQLKGGDKDSLCSLFNARGQTRVEVPADPPLMALVSGVGASDSLLVRVADLSGGGMAVEYDPGHQALVEGLGQVTVGFPSPLDGRPLSLTARARSHRVAGTARRLGLEFDAQATPDFESVRAQVLSICEMLQGSYLRRAAG